MTALAWTMIALVLFTAWSMLIWLLGWYAGRANGILFASDEVRAVRGYDNLFGTLLDGRVNLDHPNQGAL